MRKLTDLPETVTSQIEHFFINYNSQAGKTFQPTDRSGRKRAKKLLDDARHRLQRRGKK